MMERKQPDDYVSSNTFVDFGALYVAAVPQQGYTLRLGSLLPRSFINPQTYV